MYYSVEYYPKRDIIIRDNITNSEYEDILEPSYYEYPREITYRTDGAQINTGKITTLFYNNRQKRNEFVYSLLESENY